MTPRPDPTTTTIDVWTIALDALNTAAAEASLPAQERERAARRSGIDRRRFAARHAALRLIASQRLGRPSGEIALDARYGRPPTCAGLALSLSHAAGHAMIVVSPAGTNVGVDVEAVDALPLEEADALADFVLAPPELVSIRGLLPEDRRAAVVRAWCRKEAYLKLRGRGIGEVALAAVEVSPVRVLRADGDDLRQVHLADVEAPAGHLAVVAYEGAPARIAAHRLRTLEEEVPHVAC